MRHADPILLRVEEGDVSAAEELLSLVYDDLRRLAEHELSREPSGNSLQPIALVHEAYLRLVDQNGEPQWRHRGHFYAAAAESTNPAPSIHGLNLALEALAEHKLLHTEKSESLLDELSQMISQQKTTSGNLGQDFLIIEVLYREVRSKMEKP